MTLKRTIRSLERLETVSRESHLRISHLKELNHIHRELTDEIFPFSQILPFLDRIEALAQRAISVLPKLQSLMDRMEGLRLLQFWLSPDEMEEALEELKASVELQGKKREQKLLAHLYMAHTFPILWEFDPDQPMPNCASHMKEARGDLVEKGFSHNRDLLREVAPFVFERGVA